MDFAELTENGSLPQEPEQGTEVLGQLEEQTADNPTLDDFVAEQEPEAEGTPAGGEQHVTKPGSMKVRLEAAETRGHARGKKEAEEAFAAKEAEYKAQLQKLAEYELRDEAREIAAKEHISEEIAMRLLRAERGIPAPAPVEKGPARDEKGRFTSEKPQDEVTEDDPRVQRLTAKIQSAEEALGVNFTELLQTASDEDKRALWDGTLTPVAFARKAQTTAKQSPRVAASANGGRANSTIADMSDEQFERLQESLKGGHSYTVR